MGKFDKIEYDNNYIKEHYERITILVPKGEKALYRRVASEQGKTVTQFIIGACKREFVRLGIDEKPKE